MFFYHWAGEVPPPKQNINTMKRRFILFVCLLCCLPLLAEHIVVQPRTGAEMAEDVATIGKWVFVGNTMLLLDYDGEMLGYESLNNIIKITFEERGPVIPTSTDGAQPNAVIVYPNPTHEILCVQGVPDDATLRIYSAAGQLVATAQGTQINVGYLPNGTYLLQIGTQVLRFIKE